MIRLKERFVVRGGPAYQAGEYYSGEHEAYALAKGIAVRVGDAEQGGSLKAPSSPPQDKMMKQAPHKKGKQYGKR
jgi:hypothetical protein